MDFTVRYIKDLKEANKMFHFKGVDCILNSNAFEQDLIKLMEEFVI